jgi:hypothetical protein
MLIDSSALFMGKIAEKFIVAMETKNASSNSCFGSLYDLRGNEIREKQSTVFRLDSLTQHAENTSKEFFKFNEEP